MNPDDIARILDELGQRLGPSGEYVFGLAVRRVVTEGIAGLLLFIVVAIAAVIFYRRLWRWYKTDPDTNYGTRGLDASFVAAFALAPVVITGILGYFGLLNLLNPEYAALTDILSRIVP